MNAILGGSGFTSRIMERVRTEEGLAYSVGTAFPTGIRDLSLFRATAQTRSENVPRAIAAILEEMRRIQEQPVAPEELNRAEEAIINSFVSRLTSRFGTVTQLLTLEFNGYATGYLETLLDRYRAVTVADIQRVARQYLRPDAAAIFVNGPVTLPVGIRPDGGMGYANEVRHSRGRPRGSVTPASRGREVNLPRAPKSSGPVGMMVLSPQGAQRNQESPQ